MSLSLPHTFEPAAPSRPTAGDSPTPLGADRSVERFTRIDVRDLPAPTVGSIAVVPWVGPRVDATGHDVRSSYVELFWLGILGPSSTFLMRRLAVGLVHSPDGYRLPIVDTAQAMGLGTPVGRQSPFIRAMHRCCQFRLARWDGDVMQVRRKVPPLRPGQLRRLPESLQALHATLIERETRARQAAAAARPESS
jgi:hypothetical protein